MPPISWIPEAVRYATDAQSGAEIDQLTSEPVTSTNIYCEQRYTSADGHRIAISRKPFGQPTGIWACDLRSRRLCRVDEGEPLAANFRCSAVYYTVTSHAHVALMRLDLDELTTRELFRFDRVAVPHNGTVSPDERWFVGGPIHVKDNLFRLVRIDLHDGTVNPLCELEDIFNPHLQFDPATGRTVLVQINRGAQWQTRDGRPKLGNRLGATLCSVDIDSGDVCFLPAGRPHTPGMSGHESWVGQTGRIIFTAGRYAVSPSAYVTLAAPTERERAMPAAAIYSVAPGDTAPRIVAQGLLFNHLAASDDGRFFVADDHATGRIVIGNMATGAYRGLCDSRTRQGTSQASHAHAYMTPDNQHVIFNSIATGVAQVYCAQIPDGFLEAVLEKESSSP